MILTAFVRMNLYSLKFACAAVDTSIISFPLVLAETSSNCANILFLRWVLYTLTSNVMPRSSKIFF